MESAPQPQSVTTAAEFVVTLRRLRSWAGLSLRDLERRALSVGEALPRATVSGVLNRTELPREDFVATYVRACGGDPDTVDIWVSARRRLAVASEPLPAAPTTEQHTSVEAAQGVSDHDKKPAPAPNTDGKDDGAGNLSPPAPQQAKALSEQHDPAKADEAAGTARAAPATDLTPTAKTTQGTHPRRARRALIATLAMIVLLLAGTVTGIALLPDDHRGQPEQGTPPKPPVVTTSQSPTPSGPAKSETTPTSSAPRDFTGAPSPRRTPSKSPKPTPPVQNTPDPRPSSSKPTWTPRQPGPTSQPPWTPSSPSAGTGDPFPEETCWDVTNDCL